MSDMIEYKIVKITDLGTVNRGKSKHRPRNDSLLYGGKYPFIQTADIKKANLYLSDYSQTYNEIGLKQSKLWKKGTLCFTIAANIADSAILDIDACFPDSIVGFLPHENVSDTIYVKYLFDELKLYFQQISKGTTQDNLSLDKICRVKLRVPNYETQKKIALVLSSYDNLIENNNKRIKLLEQMAENLYKEWFVRFRFPGYEDVEFVGKLPSGWQYQSISESMDFFDSQRVPLSSMQRDEMEKIYPYYGAAKLMDYVDDYLFDGEYLLLGEDGTVVTTDGFPVLQLVNDKFWVNNHAHVIRGKGNISTRFLYLTFCRFPITGVVTGSAQPKISKGRLEKLKILVPDAITMEHFNNLINPMFDEINVLKKQLIRITQQRDMLLPRLMSGKLEV